MSPPLSHNTRLVGLVIFPFLAILFWNSLIWVPVPSIQTQNSGQVIIADSGGRLDGLFDGLSPNPLLAVKPVVRRFSGCTQDGLIDRALGLLAVLLPTKSVYAAGCNFSPCGGSYWIDIYETCAGACDPNTTWNESKYDPQQGSQNDGWRNSRWHGCTGAEICPCERPACTL